GRKPQFPASPRVPDPRGGLGRLRPNRAAAAAAGEGEPFVDEPPYRIGVDVETLALIEDGTVPGEIEGLERSQDLVCGARHLARRIDVLDADEPLAAGLSSVQEARDRGQQ